MVVEAGPSKGEGPLLIRRHDDTHPACLSVEGESASFSSDASFRSIMQRESKVMPI